MELLAGSRKGLSLQELSRRLSLPKSSTHYLLLTLERCGYLLRSRDTHRYMFGLKLFSLANLAVSGIKLREVAAPFLHALMKRSGLTVHMAILENDEAVVIEKIDPPGLFRLATWVGKRMDLHSSGLGKALMAYLPDEDFDRLLRERVFMRYNDNTIISRRKLGMERQQTRKLEYSLDDEEGELGFRCVGAPILDRFDRPFAAISVAGRTDQIWGENLSLYGRMVKETARQISDIFFAPGGEDGEGLNGSTNAGT